MVIRDAFVARIRQHIKESPVTAILGPRQCGKSTLAEQVAEEMGVELTSQNYFDLEDPLSAARLESPKTALEQLEGLVVIDEIQIKPDLFPILRVLADRKKSKTKFLILGSASQDLVNRSSESLAGRIALLELTPFHLDELSQEDMDKLWLRGGFPRSFLAESTEESFRWLENYIRTFLQRDLNLLEVNADTSLMRRFWMMLSHYHGQVFKAAELGNSLDVSYKTVQRYLGILTQTFMVRTLQPWHENVAKRQVKSPKIYIRDSGLHHRLMLVESMAQLQTHPRLGASWEGFALEQTIIGKQFVPEACYFWAVHEQAELDLLVFHEGKRLGFEFKYTDAPRKTASMTTAFETLRLDHLTVVYPKGVPYPIAEKIDAVPLNHLLFEGSI